MPTSVYVETHNGGYYVAGTRIGLDVVTHDFRRGRSAEAIFEAYPSIGSLARDAELWRRAQLSYRYHAEMEAERGREGRGWAGEMEIPGLSRRGLASGSRRPSLLSRAPPFAMIKAVQEHWNGSPSHESDRTHRRYRRTTSIESQRTGGTSRGARAVTRPLFRGR